MKTTQLASSFFVVCSALAASQGPPAPATPVHSQPEQTSEYVLGPEDQVRIWALGFEEIPDRPIPIDSAGDLDVPGLGRVHAGGLTVGKLKDELIRRMAVLVRQPRVSVSVAEFGSQPVSVVGAVGKPGVQQVRGRKTLIEMLSLAGGIREDAGPVVQVTRESAQGPIPLLGARVVQDGNYSVAEVALSSLMAAKRPEQNILVRPHDVITVPTAELVFVIGAVRKPGAFPLQQKGPLSVLQALSMAEGFGPVPAPQNAKILRAGESAGQRFEIPVDLKKIMAGKGEDISLRPKDVLFVPTSTAKKVSARALEAMIQTVTGVVIWRGIP